MNSVHFHDRQDTHTVHTHTVHTHTHNLTCASIRSYTVLHTHACTHTHTQVPCTPRTWSKQLAYTFPCSFSCSFSRLLSVGRALFGQGTGPIFIDSIRCTGNETSLLNCRLGEIGISDCSHSEDVSVICIGRLWIAAGPVCAHASVQASHVHL